MPDNDPPRMGLDMCIKSSPQTCKMSALQSPIHRNSHLACVVVMVRRKEGEGRRKGKGGEMPSFVRFTQLALSD